MKSKIGLLALVVFSGLVLSACTNKSTSNTTTDNSQQNQTEVRPSGTPDGRGPGQQMDLAAAAKTLGKTEEELRLVLGINNDIEQENITSGAKPSGQPKQMDLAAAAKTLGVTEEALKEALGMNNMPSGQPQGGDRPEDSLPVTKN
jgi:hypothetical protein